MMRESHLTAEEIIKYMDTSDLSEEYLIWMEEVSEHLLTCYSCHQRMRQTMLAESVCEEGELEAGLRLLAKEEKIIGKITKKLEKTLVEQRKRRDKMDKQNGRKYEYVWPEEAADVASIVYTPKPEERKTDDERDEI